MCHTHSLATRNALANNTPCPLLLHPLPSTSNTTVKPNVYGYTVTHTRSNHTSQGSGCACQTLTLFVRQLATLSRRRQAYGKKDGGGHTRCPTQSILPLRSAGDDPFTVSVRSHATAPKCHCAVHSNRLRPPPPPSFYHRAQAHSCRAKRCRRLDHSRLAMPSVVVFTTEKVH